YCDGAVKRTFDATFSAALVVALSPLLVVVALLVKTTSRRPALFRQTRVNKNGRSFTLHKFRSMHSQSPAYAQTLPSHNDPCLPPARPRSHRPHGVARRARLSHVREAVVRS